MLLSRTDLCRDLDGGLRAMEDLSFGEEKPFANAANPTPVIYADKRPSVNRHFPRSLSKHVTSKPQITPTSIEKVFLSLNVEEQRCLPALTED